MSSIQEDIAQNRVTLSFFVSLTRWQVRHLYEKAKKVFIYEIKTKLYLFYAMLEHVLRMYDGTDCQ